MRTYLMILALAAALFWPRCVRADSFGSGGNSFEIEFVTIGQPGNPADTTGSPNPAGSVPYAYRIGKFEISEQMINKANAEGALGITIDARGPDKPATSVSWFEAAQFVNWLNTSTGSVPAYKFDAGGDFQLWAPGDVGYDGTNRFRNSLATYFLPSVDEWYKAAYYDPVAGVYWDYPAGSNSPPAAVPSGTAPGTAVFNQPLVTGPADVMQAGGLSPFGTMAQGGNVGEWEETSLDLTNSNVLGHRGGRGGGWETLSFGLSSSSRSGGVPSTGFISAGFRIASIIPEPSGAALLAIAMMGALRVGGQVRPSASR